VKTDVTAVAENEVLLTVEVPPDDVKDKVERTVAKLRQETLVPGFRKGRAPRAEIMRRYGEEFVLSQTLSDFLGEWYVAALTAAELDPVSVPEVDYDEFSGDAAFSFTAKIQVRPEPRLGEYRGLEVPRRIVAVTDAQVEVQLAMLQERLAGLKPVEGRLVAADDFVEIDFAGFVDGEPLEGAKAEGYMLQVGGGNLLPGFEEALVGMAAGEEKEFQVTFPDDYRAEDLRGRQASFKAKVKEIKEKTAPPLDDEFARQASEYDTLDELREFIRARLQEAMAKAAEEEFRARVVSRVVDEATIVVPSAMVERQAHSLYHELEESVGERGIEMASYLEAVEKTAEEVEEELRPRAEAIVRQGLVLSAVREAEGVEASDDEVRDALREEAAALQRDATQHILEAAKSGRQDDLRAELVWRKTIDFLVENAVAVDTPAEELDAGEPEPGD